EHTNFHVHSCESVSECLITFSPFFSSVPCFPVTLRRACSRSITLYTLSQLTISSNHTTNLAGYTFVRLECHHRLRATMQLTFQPRAIRFLHLTTTSRITLRSTLSFILMVLSYTLTSSFLTLKRISERL